VTSRDEVVRRAVAGVYTAFVEPKAPGVVRQVLGPVVDVAFSGRLPGINTLLRVGDRSLGLPLEVVQLLGEGVARTIALDSTDGRPRRRGLRHRRAHHRAGGRRSVGAALQRSGGADR
jgi:hypothetical protein